MGRVNGVWEGGVCVGEPCVVRLDEELEGER